MELFYSAHFQGNNCYLEADEALHCIRVLRHKTGDTIHVIDGFGTLFECILTETARDSATAVIVKSTSGWGSHPYNLTLAVCPTKNNERFEWFVEKAVELGVDRIIPLIGDRSERKVYKTERAKRIALSAAKQSLKAAVPEIAEPVSVRDFIRSLSGGEADSSAVGSSLRMIAYCFEGEQPRISIKEALSAVTGSAPGQPKITVLIGPEGDFSPEEAALALEAGFLPIHLGPSRLRTETAALTAVATVYLHYLP